MAEGHAGAVRPGAGAGEELARAVASKEMDAEACVLLMPNRSTQVHVSWRARTS